MSTNYYNIKEPFGNVKLWSNPVHFIVDLYDEPGAHVGTLTFNIEDQDRIIDLLMDDEPVCYSYGVGGRKVAWEWRSEPRSRSLFSEYGELVDIREIFRHFEEGE